jgi:hypothetical protein
MGQNSDRGVVCFNCGVDVHRLRVSGRGRITLLDYDSGHQVRDVLAALRREPTSTCALVMSTLRERAFRAFYWTSLSVLFAQFANKRMSRRVHEEPSGPVDGLLAEEMAACEFTGSWHTTPAGLHVQGSLYPFRPVEFLQCRRRILGEDALRHGVTMSTHSHPWTHEAYYLPLQLLSPDDVRVLVLAKAHCYASNLSLSLLFKLRARTARK